MAGRITKQTWVETEYHYDISYDDGGKESNVLERQIQPIFMGEYYHFRPLHFACMNGHEDIVQILIAAGVILNEVCKVSTKIVAMLFSNTLMIVVFSTEIMPFIWPVAMAIPMLLTYC
jgi:ankyrin repeat protein